MSTPTPPPRALVARVATPGDVPAMRALFNVGYGAQHATSEVETEAGLCAPVAGRWAASLIINSTGYASGDPTKRSALAVYTRAGYAVLAEAGDTVVL